MVSVGNVEMAPGRDPLPGCLAIAIGWKKRLAVAHSMAGVSS